MADEFDVRSWKYRDSYSWSREYIVPSPSFCHICRVCRRPRSSRYHSEHPIPFDGVPPPPGICRRCRILPAEDNSSVEDTANAKEQNESKPALGSFASDEESVTSFVTKKSKDHELLEDSRAQRLNIHSVSYRYVEMAETPIDSVAEKEAQGDIDTDDTDGSAVLIHPPRREPVWPPGKQDAWFNSRKSKSESAEVASVKSGVASTLGRGKRPTPNENSITSKHIDATIKEEIRLQLTREVQRIAREESVKYHEQSMKLHEPPASDERMRRIARDEVERYRQVERKMEAHGNVFAHGRMVPMERSNDEGRILSHVEQHKRSATAAIESPSRKAYRAAEVHTDVDSATVWHAARRASSYHSSTSRVSSSGVSKPLLRTYTSPNDGSKVSDISMRRKAEPVSGPPSRGGGLGESRPSNAVRTSATWSKSQGRDRGWRMEARIRGDPIDAESSLSESEPSLQRQLHKEVRIQRPLIPQSPRPPQHPRPPQPSPTDSSRIKRSDGPRQKHTELDPPDEDTFTLPRAAVLADALRGSAKTNPVVRLYYRHPEVSEPKSHRRTAERTQVNDATRAPNMPQESSYSRSEQERMSARRYSSDRHLESDEYLESETYIQRRRPSPNERLGEPGSNSSKPESKNPGGLSSRSASDMPSSRRDSIINGGTAAHRSASFSPVRHNTGNDSGATSKPGQALDRSSQTQSSPLMRASQVNRRSDAIPAMQGTNLSRPERGMLGPYAEDMRKRSESMKVHDGSMVSEDNRRTSHHDRRRRERR